MDAEHFPLLILHRKADYLCFDAFPRQWSCSLPLFSLLICLPLLLKRSLCDSDLEVKFK